MRRYFLDAFNAEPPDEAPAATGAILVPASLGRRLARTGGALPRWLAAKVARLARRGAAPSAATCGVDCACPHHAPMRRKNARCASLAAAVRAKEYARSAARTKKEGS